ncbi:hypothetical protein CBFG_00051 [Clostridiales bacterium 1_7_47FAA]|uniref:Uncharacterized protein n=1 Tax=Enterocloster hominis (ex Hitch et al. 2024) TaxID=1917870 RepID=A0ABV1D7S2_9FIRM|nr:hypothetical protein CBFG_00051 [Clostridiales bacterium 1_7_47FAA]
MRGRITTYQKMEQAVVESGFLPFFKNDIPGFSVEERTPPELWFPDDEGKEGPWEWKGPVVRGGRCVYGKFFEKRAGFVSIEWLPDFANYRRDGYDFDARCDDGLVFYKDKSLYDTVEKSGSILTPELKSSCNYRKGGNKGFETIITRLQMQTYITIADFEYRIDKNGQQYGWGVARYATPEYLLGTEVVQSAYSRSPEESKERILRYLRNLLPKADEEQLLRLIG